MIEAKDLRIGNYIYSQEIGGNVQISSINEEYVTFSECVTWDYPSYEDIHPIPLTEEILLKCGFEKVQGFIVGVGLFYSYKHNKLKYSLSENLRMSILDIDIKYIHQLQNLYFYLSGDELEIKL